MKFVVIVVLIGFAAGQTCGTDGSTGLCFNGTPCPSGSTCITSTLTCCANDKIVSDCADKINPSSGVSDCPKMASYCNNAVYYDTMTEQCPKTCGRCSGSSTCVDQVNPSTGKSDCPQRKSYCNNSIYYDLMTVQCPKTCGRC